MSPSALRRGIAALLPFLLAALGAGCSSRPSQFYLLSSVATSQQSSTAEQRGAAPASFGSSRAAGTVAGSSGPLVGVVVTVPEYLDRLDIVERVGANEVKPIYSAQWGESLAVTATRAVAENLIALLPSGDVIMLPSRIGRLIDYQVNLDLTRFESDSQGRATAAGRWSISDREGRERASGRVLRSETAERTGYDAMAAAMSRNLAAVSTDIAAALQKLFSKPGPTAVAPRGGRTGAVINTGRD
jgi:uncharacterized lipoprotein YmbA